jgi:hypothetical protein
VRRQLTNTSPQVKSGSKNCQLLAIWAKQVHGDSVKPRDPGPHTRHAARTTPDVRLDLDTADHPSVFTQAQDSAEVKGLTLHTDPMELRRDLQRDLAAMHARDQELQARAQAVRIRWLAITTVLLWLATLIVLLAHL